MERMHSKSNRQVLAEAVVIEGADEHRAVVDGTPTETRRTLNEIGAVADERQALIEAGVMPLWNSFRCAAYLEVTISALDEWAHRGVGPPFLKVGRARRYRQTEIDNWLQERRHAGAA